jgi:hypothetical protein
LFLTAALSFKKGFSTRTLSEFGREPLLLVLKFQLNPGHPRATIYTVLVRFGDFRWIGAQYINY